MKNLRFKFSTIAAIMISALCLIGCEGCDDKEPDVLSVTPNRLTFSADDIREQTVEISTNASSWKYSGGDSWLDIYTKQDDKLYINAQHYTNTETARTSTITITAGDATPVTINIEQTAKEINSLSVSPTSLSFESNEIGDKTVAVTTNAPGWDATTDASWLTLSKSGNTLKVTVPEENKQPSERTANIKITAGNAPEITLTVTQAAGTYLTVDPASLSYDANETGEKTVTVSTNASNWSATTNASWLTLSKSGNTLRVNVKSQNTNNTPLNAEVKITADKAPDVILPVTQAKSDIIIYNTAEGFYYGNAVGTGNANFAVRMYNATDPNVGFQIDGFCDLPSSFANFRINTGTYTVAKTGSKFTFWPGSITDDNKFYGTLVYNFHRNEMILITGGTFTVESSGNTYTVTTNLTGKNYDTNATVNNITLKFSGTIPFTNVPPTNNNEIVRSSYTATGTPTALSTSAKNWTGTITPNTSGSNKYYTISNWGNDGITVRCNDKNSSITMDITTRVAENSTNSGYFMPGIVQDNTLIVIVDYAHPVKYTPSTKILDFSGTLEGYQIVVGVAALSKSTGQVGGVFTDFYRYAKLTLSPSAYAPQFTGEVAVRSSEIKNYTVKKMTLANFKRSFGKNATIDKNTLIDNQIKTAVSK